MKNAAPLPSSRRVPRPVRLLALLLAVLGLAGMPAAATAQTLMQEPQTKEQVEQAQKAAESTTTATDSGDSFTIPLLVMGAIILVGAAWWILRDASDAVGDSVRAAPSRPLDTRDTGRGAPRTMFTGEGEPGGKTGKRKKREQGRRQRQARKANRPR